MVETLHLSQSISRSQQYAELIPQIDALVSGESDLIANISNVAAALHQCFGFLWIGFYLVKEEQLVLGPFQGPIACTRISKGAGVCGTAWATKQVQRVPDVNQFPGHIACSSETRSEIVLPICVNNEVIAVLDIDSIRLNEFSEMDQQWLEKLCRILERKVFS